MVKDRNAKTGILQDTICCDSCHWSMGTRRIFCQEEWAVYVDGELRSLHNVEDGGSVKIDIDVGEEVSVVALRSRS
jgi:hypothetical protein